MPLLPLLPRPVWYLITALTCLVARLLLSWAWPATIALACLINIFDGAQYAINQGTRTWPSLQAWSAWSWFASCMWGKTALRVKAVHAKLIDGIPQAIVSAHPHGIMSWNHGLFFTNIAGYATRFPQVGACRMQCMSDHRSHARCTRTAVSPYSVVSLSLSSRSLSLA